MKNMKIMKIMKHFWRTAEKICFVKEMLYKTNFRGYVLAKNLHIASYSSLICKLSDM